jgi:phage tail-like protein
MMATVLQRLAALSIDAARSVVVADRFAIIMRDPQADETAIPIDSTIYLRIVDLSGAPADALVTILPNIYVDLGAGEVLAYENGAGFLAPWDGVDSAETSSAPGAPYSFRDFTLDLATGPFASEAEVTVHIVLDTSTGGWGHFLWGHETWGHFPGGITHLDLSYSFIVADVIRPNVVGAEAVAPEIVRVRFDDRMSVAGATSVLDLDAWTPANNADPVGFLRLNVDPYPAVNISAFGVELAPPPYDDGTTFDVSTNWEMTPGQLYRVTVRGTVADDAGNLLDGATATFAGFVPEAVEGRSWDYWRLMPYKNRVEDASHDLERFARCIDETMQLLTYTVDRFPDQYDPDLASDATIDAMLYDCGNPFDWVDLDLTPIQRRKLLRLLVPIYRMKGTARGLEDVVYLLLGEVVTVVEHLGTGWELGTDELGVGGIAELFSAPGPFDLSAGDRSLTLSLDGGASIVCTFAPADFVDPSAATAAEVALVLNTAARWLAGAVPATVVPGAYRDAIGLPARILGAVAEPFAFAGGETVEVTADGIAIVSTLRALDIATPGAATAAEVAACLTRDLAPWATATVVSGAVAIETCERGPGVSLEVTGGTAAAALGLALATPAAGADAERVALYSPTTGVDASIAATAGGARALLGLDDAASVAGGSILAISEGAALYSFDVEADYALSSQTETLVRRISEYMKPAHTHLLNVRTAPALPWPDGWTLGVSALDLDAALAE